MRLYKDKEDLHFEIIDDGIGRDIKKISILPAYGLMGIRGRVRAMNGEVSIEDTTRKRTTVWMIMPGEKQEMKY